MNETTDALSGPDLAAGLALTQIADGAMLLGHAHGKLVLLARRGAELFAIGATCTHYGAPLADGLMADDTVRCTWHHACFSRHTGAVLRALALDPVSCWRVEQRDGKVHVGALIVPERPPDAGPRGIPQSVMISGGGAASNAAAETLRLEGCCGRITMLTADASRPCDRLNFSKRFLAGTAESAALGRVLPGA